MLNSSELFSYQVSSGMNYYFLVLVIVYTDTQTERRKHRHTDGHEYFIVAVDKPQL